MNGIHIRRATLDDARALAEFGAYSFHAAFAPDNKPEDMAAYLASAFSPEIQAVELANTVATFLIAEHESKLVGYAQLVQSHAPAGVSGQQPIELLRIYAHPDWTGRGVGSVIMQACLDLAAGRGCDTLWLGVWEHNTRAQAFYRRWGFSVVGEQSFMLGSDLQRDLVMQRPVKLPSNT